MTYKIAVVGATGNVGREMLNILYERKFPASEVIALASDKSKGKQVSFGEQNLRVEALSAYDFYGTDIALFSAGASTSAKYANLAAEQGCIVIDNSSSFRGSADIPLIVPEVNVEELQHYSNHNIIANPNCAVLQMVVALKPLHDHAKVKRIVVATYQSVSGAGRKAMNELFKQTQNQFFNKRAPRECFPRCIAFNLIPQIGDILPDGYTEEEVKVINETKKILSPEIKVTATCVRVPLFIGHSEAVTVEFEDHITPEIAYDLLKGAPCVTIPCDPAEDYITPLDCVGQHTVYVSRIRQDNSTTNGLSMWVVSDNLRKGAALNAVQIAEELINKYL